MRVHGIAKGLMIAILIAVAMGAFGFLVKWLWNWLMPPLFGLHALGYWQALGLLVLCKILFGGFGGRHGFGGNRRMRLTSEMNPEERVRLREVFRRWPDMTPEERDKCRTEICGGGGPTAPAADATKA